MEGMEPFRGKGVVILQAPINNSTFRYLNLIKLHKSNYDVRIIIIIISIKKMFRKISQLAAKKGNKVAKYVKY